MKSTEFFIRRPVFTAVLSLVLIVLGLLGFLRMPVRGYPDISPPIVSVVTTAPGVSASIIESQITTPIENNLVGLNGITTLSSTSKQGVSHLVLQFDLGINIDAAVNDVRDALSTISQQLPTGTDTPIIQKRDPNDMQTLVLMLHDPHRNTLQLTDYADRYLLPQLEKILGVAAVEIYSARNYTMHISLDPEKMAARNVTVSDLTQTLTAQNIDVPAGQIKSQKRYYSILSQGELNSTQQFRDLIIREDHGYLLRFSDVADVTVGAKDTDNVMRVDGQEAVGIGVYSAATANPIQVAQRVQQALQSINQDLPEGMKLQTVWDSTSYLDAALHAVYHDILIALLLVSVIIFLFLGSWRSTLIPFVTIPICLIGVCALIYFLGYSINVFTLLAFVLAIGLVVDDAIVMLENIYRHVEDGLSPFQAAIKGSREIGFAIVAMTLTLAAVYAPIGFATGMTGIVFRQFAFTLALAIILSGFVALTLSPMMCARWLSSPKTTVSEKKNYHVWLDQSFLQLVALYRRLLTWILAHRIVVVCLLSVIAGLGYICFKALPTELTPAEDMSVFFVKIIPPANASFEYTNQYSKQLESLIRKIPAVQSVISMVGDNQSGFDVVILKPLAQREASAQQVMRTVMEKSRRIPGARAVAFNMGALGGGGQNGDSVGMIISSDQSFSALSRAAQKIIDATAHDPTIASANAELRMNDKQYLVHVNQELAASLGVNVADITNTLKTMLGGAIVTQFNWEAHNYDVVLQIPLRYLKTLDVINQLYVRNSSGKMIPLSSLASITPQIAPQELPHEDRLRANIIYFQLSPGTPMGNAIQHLQNAALALPAGFQYHFKGAAERLLESRHTMVGSFLLALVFIYLVLAAQFESFIDPLIILLSVPLSMVGALFMLKLTGNTLSLYTNIGFITLIGLIAKHGILITEFANQKRRLGESLMAAIVDAASLRLRPILMTTAAMTIGALPLALAHGMGAVSRHHIGWVIVGGLLFGTFFSLIVVPVAYSFFGKFKRITVSSHEK